jgi:HAD superfamily hydrolase (TIGR01459 family)
MTGTGELAGVAALAGRYRVWLCDVWGVVHDGLVRFDAAVEALQRFRAGGGCVVLLTNAPRPASHVLEQMADLGVTSDAFDAIATSGDATRDLIAVRRYRRVLHVGPERDLPFFEGLDVERVGDAAAECVVCTGLDDELGEQPRDYRARFSSCVARGLTFYCANPDRVVRRGAALYHCAGALADVYAALGGEVVMAGKPHPPIYARALESAAAALGTPVGPREVLVIGDGIETDMRGAADQGFDALFVLDGIHAAELGLDGDVFGPPQVGHAMRALASRVERLDCIGVLRQLRW